MNAENTLIVMVDVQEKLFPHIHKNRELEKKMGILLQGAKTLGVPIMVNEQYKKGLGATVAPLQELIGAYQSFEKTTFSCCKNDATFEAIKAMNKEFVVVFGVETHICVMQTVLDLNSKGYKTILVADCVGSRKEKDTEVAIQRMVQAGVVPTTYESFLFEILVNAKHEKFKEISKLVK